MIFWEEAERRLMHILADWQVYLAAFDGFQPLLGAAMMWAPVVLMSIACLEVVGGLLLFFGIKEKFGSFLLIFYLLPASIVLHPFWFLHSMDREVAVAFFLKDLAILGGLLLVMVHGAKGPSLPDDGSLQ